MEISKELLSEVLSIKVFTEISENDYGKNNILVYWEFDGYHNHCRNINIYELAFKCKEWAYSKCNEIISYTEGCEIFQTQMGEKIKDFYAETEIEAIFKACQWILDNK